jgi:hypothetical protein
MTKDRPVKSRTNKRRARTIVQLPESFSALVVTSKARRPRAHRRTKNLQVSPLSTNGGCIFPTHDPTSVITRRGVDICKYTVAGDANSSDSVSFQGGPTVVNISLVPIFYGSDWLISSPSYTEVMAGIAAILDSPYLSQLDQYGFHSLNLKQPVLNMAANPRPRHSTDDPGNIVWDLIDNDVFPEPDDAGGYNIYMVFYPPNTSVSNRNICGWHDRYLDYDFPFDIDEAWVGAVDFPVGNTSSLILDNIIRVFSHELVEILTDPEANGGWRMGRKINGDSEIGDACNNSVDYLRGVLVNAYWSERHKACIIPKPSVHATIQVADTVTSRAVIASGVADFLQPVCLKGQYSWTASLETHRVIISATPPPRLQDPVFVWRIEDAQQGPIDLANGFSGTVFLATDTWYDDVTGASMRFGVFPVGVKVNAGTLTLTNGTPSEMFSFLFRAYVSVSEGGLLPAAADIEYRVNGEVFRFEQRYYDALRACFFPILQRLHAAHRRAPRASPDDLAWIWQDRLSPWITGDRLLTLAEIASGCAAIENFGPQLAYELRAEAAIIGSVPAQVLLPTRVRRGVAQ